jgi:hypothetical protein
MWAELRRFYLGSVTGRCVPEPRRVIPRGGEHALARSDRIAPKEPCLSCSSAPLDGLDVAGITQRRRLIGGVVLRLDHICADHSCEG